MEKDERERDGERDRERGSVPCITPSFSSPFHLSPILYHLYVGICFKQLKGALRSQMEKMVWAMERDEENKREREGGGCHLSLYASFPLFS